jgi:PAS domain S-box-containing protein
LTHALRRKGLDVDEVAEILDETSQELRFSRQLLAATMENVTQGISVVDADMNLVAWNHRYLELFDYPNDMVYVGRPVADLIRWNAQRGEFGAGDPEQQVAKRLAHMRAGTAYTFQRERRNGQVFSINGQPMAGGGFVSTYTDITEFKRTEQALLDAKQELEARVEQRTRELSDALDAQRTAKLQAEAANIGKTRFVAAASHDLLQPLNAARLFASALESRAAAHPELVELASRIDGSMRAAEELLKDLLDIAQLDIGVMRPDITTFSIAELLEDLRRQYAPLALSRRLRLDVVSCREAVRSDRVLLRRILQNYLSNGLRYCERGGVLIGCRRRAAELEICVYDTGPGIASHEREHLYVEFTRLEQGSPWGEKGLGLGLSICDRLARLLNHELTLSSQPGHGSVFGVRVPRVAQARRPERLRPPAALPDPGGLREFKVLVVDNDLSILDAMRTDSAHRASARPGYRGGSHHRGSRGGADARGAPGRRASIAQAAAAGSAAGAIERLQTALDERIGRLGSQIHSISSGGGLISFGSSNKRPASSTAWVRLAAPSLRRMAVMCAFTVASVICSS